MPKEIIIQKTSIKGIRENNEDVDIFILNLDFKNNKSINNKYAPIDFFIICDGHGGDTISKYVAPMLKKHLTKANLIFPLNSTYIKMLYKNLQSKLILKFPKYANIAGSTALIIIRFIDLKNNDCIQVINLGDCRAVLSKNGLAQPLCKDHKPSWPDEKKRIEKINKEKNLKEKIKFLDDDWRIGGLSVSRSFGDKDHEPYISCEPDIYNYYIENKDEFIVMACDGLWDVLQNHDVVNFIKDHINNNDNSLDNYPKSKIKNNNIAQKLAEYALKKGTTDNITIIILFFK